MSEDKDTIPQNDIERMIADAVNAEVSKRMAMLQVGLDDEMGRQQWLVPVDDRPRDERRPQDWSDFPEGDKWTWGILLNDPAGSGPDYVTIYNSAFKIGDIDTYSPYFSAEIQITENDVWIYAEMDTNGTVTLHVTTDSGLPPYSTATIVRKALYRMQWTDAVVGPPAVPAHVTGWDRDGCHYAPNFFTVLIANV